MVRFDLESVKTALVVVDMQNAFMLPGVAHALCDEAREIVPNINRLAAAARACGGTVVWVKNTFGTPSLASWPVFHAMTGPERTRVETCRGEQGAPVRRGGRRESGAAFRPPTSGRGLRVRSAGVRPGGDRSHDRFRVSRSLIFQR